MLQLIQISIGIRVIHERVQKVKSRPNWHFFFVQFEVVGLFFQDKIVGLVRMVQTIELPHRVAFGVIVVAKFFFGFGRGMWLRVAEQQVIFPLVEATQGCIVIEVLIHCCLFD